MNEATFNTMNPENVVPENMEEGYPNPFPYPYPANGQNMYNGFPVNEPMMRELHTQDTEPKQEAPDPEQEQETIEKPYSLARLKSSDLFLMLKILRKINLQEIKECFSDPMILEVIKKSKETGEDIDFSSLGVSVVLEIAGVIVSNMPSAEMEIYSLLSRLSGIKTEDLKEMDAVIFFEMVVDVIKKPEFKDFYKVASGFIK